MALMWCEARCDLMESQIGCLETSNGAFGVKEATRLAKQQGWKIVNDEWVCPRCYAEFKATRP